MNNEQIIELVEKWLSDNSSVTVKELKAVNANACFAAAIAAWDEADWTAAAAANTAYWAATDADADWAADAAKYVAEYRELAK